jgi:hypothetical protein
VVGFVCNANSGQVFRIITGHNGSLVTESTGWTIDDLKSRPAA